MFIQPCQMVTYCSFNHVKWSLIVHSTVQNGDLQCIQPCQMVTYCLFIHVKW